MKDSIKKGLLLGLGLMAESREQAEKWIADWTKKGELTVEESKEMIQRLVQLGEEERNQFRKWINDYVKQYLEKLDIATKDDFRRLEQRIQKLEEILNKKDGE